MMAPGCTLASSTGSILGPRDFSYPSPHGASCCVLVISTIKCRRCFHPAHLLWQPPSSMASSIPLKAETQPLDGAYSSNLEMFRMARWIRRCHGARSSSHHTDLARR